MADQQQSHSTTLNPCYSFNQQHHRHNHQHHHHQMKMSLPISQPEQQQQPENDQNSVELRALDCNLASLCDHIQLEGFNNGVFSDIVVHAMGSTYHLHRLILSRSSYFRSHFFFFSWLQLLRVFWIGVSGICLILGYY